MAKQTPMKWSQRADSVLLVIPLRDVENTDVHFSNNRFQFSGNSNGAGYFLDVELFKDIDVQASSWTVKPTSVELKLAKKVVRDPFWPRLLLNKALERNNVTVDWDRYMDEEDLEVNFADEIQNLDAIIADAEEETLITDEILSSLEYHSLYADETISGLTKDFDAINVDADVLISTDNFDPNDPKKRPKLWQNVLSKRVMIKEYVEELEGVSSLAVWKYLDNESAETQVLSTGSYDAIPRMLTLEDKKMVSEVKEKGRLFSIDALRVRDSIERAAMTITEDNFDAFSFFTDARPPAWNAIRLRRVLAKEDMTKRIGDEMATRPRRIMEEENLMLGEVLKFGQVQGFGSPQEDPAKVSKVLASGGDSARLSRIRERASSIEQERLSMRASSSTPDRASATRSSVVRTSMMRHSSIRPSLARIQEEEETMTVEEIEFRDATMKKVILLEQAERERGVDEDTIQLNRPKKEAEVRNLLSSEVKEHGRVRSVSVAKGRRRAPTLTQANMTDEIEPGDFVANDPGRRPSFWAEVKLKRVMLKEHVERISGLPEQTIVSQRFMKEVEEELLMTTEVLLHGRLLKIGEPKPLVRELVAPGNIARILSSSDTAVRPARWDSVKRQRVQLRELEDRLVKHRDNYKLVSQATMEAEEEALMAKEAEMLGKVSLTGQRRLITDLCEQVQAITLNSAPATTAAKVGGNASSNVSKSATTSSTTTTTTSSTAGDASVSDRVVIEVRAEDMNNTSSDTSVRPKGWGAIKQHKVYMKEWQDRKDGVDDDDIYTNRFNREREAEDEMNQALSVHGHIQIIEKRMKQLSGAAVPVFPKGYTAKSLSK